MLGHLGPMHLIARYTELLLDSLYVFECLTFMLHLYRVLDSNSITGVVNVTRIHQIIDATATIYAVQSLGVVSLMNNNITDVAYQPDDVLNNRTLFK
jgi:hypothetical protein